MSLLVSDPHRIDRLLRRHGSAVQLAVLAAFFVACVALGVSLPVLGLSSYPAEAVREGFRSVGLSALGAFLIVTAVSVPGAVLFYWVHLLGDEADGDNPE